MTFTERQVLEWAEFVATKFGSSREGWAYSRNLGNLEHIRYTSDRTGYNHWWKRLVRGISFSWRTSFGSQRVVGTSITARLSTACAYFLVKMRKDAHLPDGVVNGGSIITFWEEDGEYITLFGPTVGVKVLDFLWAEPDNPHAQAIVTEMVRLAEKSWGSKEDE